MLKPRSWRGFVSLAIVLGSGLFVFSQLSGFPVVAQDEVSIGVRLPEPPPELPAFAADQIIVKFKPNIPPEAIEQLKTEHGVIEELRSTVADFVTFHLPEGSNVTEKAEMFARNPIVAYAQPNFVRRASFVPNDPFYQYQWHFDDDNTINPGGASSNPYGGANGGGIGMEQAWNTSTGSASVVVAVLDTGAAYENYSDPQPAGCYNIFGQLVQCSGAPIDDYYQAPDLANTSFSILPGSDFVNSDNHPNDDEGHGTHVTGTVAQSTNNNLGVAGTAFNTTVMPVKVLDANGAGLDSVIANAIYFATNNGADIISMSLGGPGASQVLEDAVAYAFNNGATVVAAGGNSFQSGNPIEYPAGYDAYVIAVGATRYDETRSYYSNTGPQIDVTAPGGDVTVDQNGDSFADGVLQQTFLHTCSNNPFNLSVFAYCFYQGTSMATPHVAGLAALLLSVDNSLTPTQLRNALESTAEDKGAAGRDDEYGHGIIDAVAALGSLAPQVSIILTTDGTTPFGTVPLGDTIDTTATGTNDVQTVQVTTGPADLKVKSTTFSGDANVWTLGSTSSSDQVKWDFSEDGASWTTFTAPDTLFTASQYSNVAQGASRNVYLRLTMPTATSSNAVHTSTVTIVATAP